MSEASTMSSTPPISLTQDWTGHTLDMMGALLLVIAAVFLVSMVLRHLQTRSSGIGGHLKILQAMSVGTKDRVLLVQVGVDQILMSVSAAGIRHLHTLSEPVEVPDDQNTGGEAVTRSFANTIKSIAGKQSL